MVFQPLKKSQDLYSFTLGWSDIHSTTPHSFKDTTSLALPNAAFTLAVGFHSSQKTVIESTEYTLRNAGTKLHFSLTLGWYHQGYIFVYIFFLEGAGCVP